MNDVGAFSFAQEFNALANMLKDPDEAEVPKEGVSKPGANPGAIGPSELFNVKVPAPKAKKDPKDIWDDEEVTDAVEDDIEDGRIVPVYEFIYKQAVESTDMFLGMSGKDESSTSCEDMVLRIELPGVSSAEELDLDVKSTYVKLNHAKYKLSIYLPHRVNEDKGKARWDSKKETLSVTLPIIRDDNF
ncbi:hypothetical protein CEUSTIGMA_g7780.t1 [Chlamydomonas eustigma]|uniref:PIH1D1/2/3 CS-like domain-containing protein n=1 Tax=Chlamydomonas eustigma TaxID=1157962 RepID=A0A250XBU0_9CHLO|nr:hypothetical protein CEUSTIGMA_g7780.t1 [Chlamydomonas eustigma]|eukprot:GAX80342.1 hypothetical protein CEUSTIGMA_g7780.t1 [Chlamydomonas eustigma]